MVRAPRIVQERLNTTAFVSSLPRLPSLVLADVLDRLGDVRLCRVGQRSLVAGDHHLAEPGQPREGVVGDHAVGEILVEVLGLLLVDIQTGVPDPAGLRPVDQRLGVDRHGPWLRSVLAG